nr:hypothetical protein [Lachnospiraceae bacterium]
MRSVGKKIIACLTGILLLAGSVALVRTMAFPLAETKEQIDEEAVRSLESLVSEDAQDAEAAVYAVREQRAEESARYKASVEESYRQRASSVAASLKQASLEEESRIAQMIWEEESRKAESAAIARSAAASRAAAVQSIAEADASLAEEEWLRASSIAEAESLAEESRAVASREAAEAAARAEAERSAAESRAAESRAAESRAAETTAAQPPVSTGQIVFVGDSRTSGFIGAGLMPASRCLVYGGAVYAWYDNVRAAAAMQPSKVVFFGGQNDLGVYHGNATQFINAYTDLIRYFQSLSPGTRIYCNLIFPCTDVAVAEMPGRENRAAYNAAIAQMCAENGWTCIDTTAGFNSSYFGADGIHFFMSWYPIWWQNLRSSVGF